MSGRPVLVVAAGLALAGGIWIATRPDRAADAPPTGAALAEVARPDALSEEAQIGRRAFDASCAACHGEAGAGVMGAGPPLVHVIYEPSHHGDMAFAMAVQNGVQAHHWSFGDMPAQDGLTGGDVAAIVAYIREVQRANGID